MKERKVAPDQFCQALLRHFPDPIDRARATEDIRSLLVKYPHLILVEDCFYNPEPEGVTLALSGQLNVPHRESRRIYGVNVMLWVRKGYPSQVPAIFIFSPPEMFFKKSHSFVATTGQVTIPYLSQWKTSCTLVVLYENLAVALATDFPFFQTESEPSLCASVQSKLSFSNNDSPAANPYNAPSTLYSKSFQQQFSDHSPTDNPFVSQTISGFNPQSKPYVPPPSHSTNSSQNNGPARQGNNNSYHPHQQTNDSSQTNGIYTALQASKKISSGAPSTSQNSFPSFQTINGYAPQSANAPHFSQNANGYVPSQNTNGYVSSQNTNGYVSSQNTNGYVSSQNTNGYVSSQNTNGYVPSQNTNGYVPSQNTNGYVSPQSLNINNVSQNNTKNFSLPHQVEIALQAHLFPIYEEINQHANLTQDLQDKLDILTQLCNRGVEEKQQLSQLERKLDQLENEIKAIQHVANETPLDTAVITQNEQSEIYLNSIARDQTLEDVMFYLEKGLNKGVLSLEDFLKYYRETANQQFYERALQNRITETHGVLTVVPNSKLK